MTFTPEVILGWVLVAIVIGLAAKGMGRSGVAWFLVAIVISPLLAGIALFFVNAVGSPQGAPAKPEVADEIAKLAALRDAGNLTSEEYEARKGALLQRG